MPFGDGNNRSTSKYNEIESDKHDFSEYRSIWQSDGSYFAMYLPSGKKDENLQLPAMGGIYHPSNLGLYTYVDNGPLIGIDPTGLWAIKFSFYSGGRGGSFTLGHDDGKWFVRAGVGVGAGKGFKIYPTGTFPVESTFPGGESEGPRAFIGSSASAAVSVGPASAEAKWQAGWVVTKDPETGKPKTTYIDEGKGDWSLKGKTGFGVGASGGLNIVDVGVAW